MCALYSLHGSADSLDEAGRSGLECTAPLSHNRIATCALFGSDVGAVEYVLSCLEERLQELLGEADHFKLDRSKL